MPIYIVKVIICYVRKGMAKSLKLTYCINYYIGNIYLKIS